MCDGKFLTNTYLYQHKRKDHDEFKPYTCDTCGKKFAYESLLKGHRHTCKIVDIHKLPFYCELCGTRFKEIRSLKRHNKQHCKKQIIEKSFDCELCGKSLSAKQSLKRHKKLVHLKVD